MSENERSLMESMVFTRGTSGLEAAVRFLCHEFTRSQSIAVDITVEELEIPVSTDVSMAYFRIVQEALANVVRHAKASSVSVNLYAQDSALLMSIRDNGIGFDVDALDWTTTGEQWGLRGMRERAQSIGGELVIASQAGGGTTIIASHTPER